MNSFEASHQLCNVTLLGNLVAKPEIRYLANPILAISDITVATTYRWKDKLNHNKEWTSFHHVKVIGKAVEETLINANKGDILLVNGYIANNKTKPVEIVHANTIEHFAKGFTQNINQITCSATITSAIKLVTTESNNQLATFNVSICHHAFSEHKNESLVHHVERPVQLWGQQAQQVAQQAKSGDSVIIEGRLSYANNQKKSQQIDANLVHILAK